MPRFTWTSDVDEAKAEQQTLRGLISNTRSPATALNFVHGLAIGTAYDENTKSAVAAAMRFNKEGRYEGQPIVAHEEVDFPYIPGLLAFRVGPAVCNLLDRVEGEFDLLLFDGQGIAHPRGIGLASHIGVLYDKMSLGVTRNNLFGRVLDPPSEEGMATTIVNQETGAILGHSIILGEACPPAYVSPGHRMTADEALRILRQISRTGSCFPTCLARAHSQANATSRKLGREGYNV